MRKFLIKVNGNPYEVEVEEVKAGNVVSQPAREVKAAAPVQVPVAASAPAVVAKPVEAKPQTAVPAGATTINAPMPGTILKVIANEGDIVKKGQPLLILEAMKMENEIVAPVDGKVSAIYVVKGKSVSVNEVLVSLV